MLKIRKISCFLSCMLLAAVLSCDSGGSSKSNNNTDIPVDSETADNLNTATENQAFVDSKVESAVSYFFDQIPEGEQPTVPVMPATPSGVSRFSNSAKSPSKRIPTFSCDSGSWFGPDALGWYWRNCNWGYGDSTLTEYMRCIPEDELNDAFGEVSGREAKTDYYMGDAYGSTTFATESKTVLHDTALISGYYDFTWESDGYSNQQTVRWDFTYENVDPTTGAGYYQYCWGGSINDQMPYDCYMTITATDVGDGLHVEIEYYDSTWSWEFDCPYTDDFGLGDLTMAFGCGF